MTTVISKHLLTDSCRMVNNNGNIAALTAAEMVQQGIQQAQCVAMETSVLRARDERLKK